MTPNEAARMFFSERNAAAASYAKLRYRVRQLANELREHAREETLPVQTKRVYREVAGELISFLEDVPSDVNIAPDWRICGERLARETSDAAFAVLIARDDER